jgi:predicted small secreted protein
MPISYLFDSQTGLYCVWDRQQHGDSVHIRDSFQKEQHPMKRYAIILLALFALVLAGCQALGGGGDDGGDSGDGGGEAFDPNLLVNWERDPYQVIFRAQVVGGEDEQDPFYVRNEIPACTIYGDNRIVWQGYAADNTSQILEDRLTDQVINTFVQDLTVAYRIYTYDARAEMLPPGDMVPVIEQLTLNVNGEEHVTDVLSEWEYQYYEEILNRCQNLSETPVLFEPTGAWVSAREAEFDNTLFIMPWDGEAEGSVNFAELAASGERQWIEGNLVLLLWEMIRNNPPNMLFEQAEQGVYRVALEIPGVTRVSPPPPDS